METKNILFICGSLNQTTMMHAISKHLEYYNCFFTPYYADGYIDVLARKGYLDFSILGGSFKGASMNYLWKENLRVDYYGNSYNYDLVVTCSDLLVPKNIQNKKLILVQEGMTDPKNFAYYLVKWFKFPRYIASTSTNGLSDAYDIFCVASEGYKQLFVQNGIKEEKIRVTGIPNFDNCQEYANNDFPYRNFVLVATSDSRETFKFENRKKFIEYSVKIANGKQLIFKLHPNENHEKATAEINKYAPEALVYTQENIHEMIANCDVLITKYSTVVYTGIALGKEVYSYFEIDELKQMTPIQNGGTSALNIAQECLKLLNNKKLTKKEPKTVKLKNRIKNYVSSLAGVL
ncbi:MAG: CDP-glycerol glycerophosphotransferase family protein [Candidatus Kapabacteria bacterium]|nr:CDP-glycerol glycerophosphotransferase family protein [Candidatus Kapabacteria bacterium]